MNLRHVLSGCLVPVVAAALYGDTAGMRPRPTAHDYPAQAGTTECTLAASALSASQIRNVFGRQIEGYIVIELAVYPDAGGNVKLSPADFMLKIGGQGDLIRPSEPDVIARSIRRKNGPKQVSGRNVGVYPSANIGYERVSGDPAYGGRRNVWYSGVDVGVGPTIPPDPAIGQDMNRLAAEIYDKSLPEGVFSTPLSGYLYFPAPAGKKKGTSVFELHYLAGASGARSTGVRLFIPPAK